ncbi:hypothetical protein P4I20_09140 [Paenibacillus graminis]
MDKENNDKILRLISLISTGAEDYVRTAFAKQRGKLAVKLVEPSA